MNKKKVVYASGRSIYNIQPCVYAIIVNYVVTDSKIELYFLSLLYTALCASVLCFCETLKTPNIIKNPKFLAEQKQKLYKILMKFLVLRSLWKLEIKFSDERLYIVFDWDSGWKWDTFWSFNKFLRV